MFDASALHRAVLIRWLLTSLICVALGVTPALANDGIWSGLFHYQQQMAQLGNAEAQFKLAEHYEQGLGVEQDLAQAKLWYEKAAHQGYEPAAGKLKNFDNERTKAAVRPSDPAVEQLEREHKARLQAQQELARIQAEREQMEQELARQREELQRLKAEKEREKNPPAKVVAPSAAAASPAPVVADEPAVRQRQREEAIAKAEAEYRKSVERRIARERLEMEMLRLQSTPIGYDN